MGEFSLEGFSRWFRLVHMLIWTFGGGSHLGSQHWAAQLAPEAAGWPALKAIMVGTGVPMRSAGTAQTR
jgi:hypothetical protein